MTHPGPYQKPVKSNKQHSSEESEQNIDTSLSELIQKLEELDEHPTSAKLGILRGNVGRLAKTQQGSKFLQRMITNVN